MDEHRLGLKPILKRVWSPVGVRPIVQVRPGYDWLYVYGFVQPTTGRNFWLLMPTVSMVAFSIALRHFADFVGTGEHKSVRLLVDRAGFHTGQAVQCPSGLQLWFLPPYSPELQRAEHLWSLIDQVVANRHLSSLDDLQDHVVDRCNWLQDHPDMVRSTTNFAWWPQIA